MRELERETPASPHPTHRASLDALAIVGAGRAGRAIARAAENAGLSVGLHGRGEPVVIPDGQHGAVLLCVPDTAIAEACEFAVTALPSDVPVGHTSGVTTLDALAAAADRSTFSLHPLQTIPGPGTDLAGAPCAIAGSNGEVLDLARWLAEKLGMEPFEVPDEGRAAYHAAASIASNFLVTLEETAADLLGAAGVQDPRQVLTPLVLRTAANWAEHGPAALTGPITRGDEETVARHLDAIADHAPALETIYRALAERTRALAEER